MISEKTLKAETLEKQNANTPLVFKKKKVQACLILGKQE